MGGRRVARAVGFGIGAILLLAAWVFLAPSQLGGRTAYVTTVGSSMEPLLGHGDLVVVRRTSAYRVGDVIAYRSPQLGSVVLHRIVAREGDRFLLKGDGNTWLDSYRPSEQDVVGEMVLRLPGVGARLGAFRSPFGASSLVAIGAIAVLGGRRRVRDSRGRHERDRRDPAAARADLREERRPRPRGAGRAGTGTAVSTAMAALGAVLAAVLFLLPPTATVTDDVLFDQRGSFSYRARVPGGEGVYGAEIVGNGEPVYLKLTDRLQVSFGYGFDSAAATDLDGTISLTAELSDVNGWSRTFELAPTTRFEGTEATAGGSLQLDELHRMTVELERATGVDRLAYSVDVVARVDVSGTLAGREISQTFQPRLAFLLDDFQLQIERDAAPLPGEEPADPLQPASGGLLQIARDVPRTFEVLGLELAIAPLRAVALGLLVIGGAGLAVALARHVRSARGGEPATIQARFGRWLVPVHTNGGHTPDRIVEVESFESLLRLADHYGHMVLHDRRDDGHVYVVEEGGVTYRYRSPAAFPAEA